MIHSSDVGSRLPRFREIMQVVDDTEKRGGFEGVPPEYLEYIRGSVPVGVKDDGEIDRPSSYNPNDGPPILALRPDEGIEGYKLKGTEQEARMATDIALQSGDLSKITPDTLNGKLPEPSSTVAIQYMDFNMPLYSQGRSYPLSVPRLIVVGSHLSGEYLAAAAVHEIDHWDMALNHAGPLQFNRRLASERHYSRPELSVIAEKRAYGTSYAIGRNLGHYAVNDLDVLADRFRGSKPRKANAIHKRIERAGEGGVNSKVAIAVSALVLSKLFGDPTEPVTADEVAAYRKVGLING